MPSIKSYSSTAAGSFSRSAASFHRANWWLDRLLPTATTPAARLAAPIGERLPAIKAALQRSASAKVPPTIEERVGGPAHIAELLPAVLRDLVSKPRPQGERANHGEVNA